MDKEYLKINYELLQNCSYALKSLINSEIAMNDGEISDCQKYNKEAQLLLKSSINDTFKEYKELINSNTTSVNEYDLPNNFELMKQLNNVQCDLSMLLGMLADDFNEEKVIKSSEEKIAVTLNTIEEIYTAIYLN